MTSGAMVTAAEIARIAGVGPAAVSNWRRRHPDFPGPVAGTAVSPQFSLDEVVAWLREHGRAVTVSPLGELWRRMNAMRDPARPAAVLASTGAVIAGEWQPGRGDDGTDLPQEFVDQVGRLSADLGASEVFEALLDRWTQAHARQVEVTSAPIAALMAEVVAAGNGATPRTVLDPACGTGGLLSAMADGGAEFLYGQDLDPDLAEVARLRLRLRSDAESVLAAGDSLLDDAFSGHRVQAVVCNPPFGQRSWGRNELGYDSRWSYGLPPNAEPELAWLQHALAHLDSDGYVAMLMPAAAAVRPSGRRIRAELVRRGALRAVVALPSGASSVHGMGTHLWLAGPPDDNGSPQVLLIDAESVPTSAVDGADGAGEWPLVHRVVVSQWRAFLDGSGSDSEVCRILPAHDLLDNEVNLTPSRYVQREVGDAVDLRRLEEDRSRFGQDLMKLSAGPPVVAEAVAEPPALASLDDLVRTGAVRMWRGTSRRDSAREGLTEHPVITVHQGVSRTAPTGRVLALPEEAVAEGDVLLFTGGIEGTRPADPAEYGAVPGPGVTVLRPDPSVVDSWFLAGTLAHGANRRYAGSTSSSGSRTRIDSARLSVPVQGLDEQRRIGRAFQQLARFNESLDRLAGDGRDMAQRLQDALADGSVGPAEPSHR
ncbi:SAM-dependent methyltransferase [Peterkaempfera bronchialis]|uniref:SAM-dependent methyltransferase n=1 Tax=Peterkaempfera bronchialis TaxID=2126346 RepID=A0A345SYH3_9ACTN|nr:SAM-dependent methyltransferase [Peterkaempfera bronchialis]